MTADEFRKMLDRFDEALTNTGKWAHAHRQGESIGFVPLYDRLDELHSVWCILSRECALMKDAERRAVTTLDQTAVKPTRPLPEPPARMSAAVVNAKQIGKLQARVAQLERQAKDVGHDSDFLPSREFQNDDIARFSATVSREDAGQDSAVLADGSVPGRSHEDSGRRCSTEEPPIIKCVHCGEWIRPENMGLNCGSVPE